MNNLNSILIEGNLVRDAEYRATPKGTSVCKFPIASNRFYMQEGVMEKETSFIDVEAWGKLAESVKNMGRKGRGVRVVGRIKQERWQNSEGKAMSRIIIVAEHIEFRPEHKKDQTEAEEHENEVSVEEAEESLVPCF